MLVTFPKNFIILKFVKYNCLDGFEMQVSSGKHVKCGRTVEKGKN